MLGATVRDLVPDSVGSVQKNLLVEAAMDVWAANRSNLSAVGRQTLVEALAGIHGGQSQAIDRLVTRLTAAGISQQTAEAAAEGLAQRLGSLQNADDAAIRTALQAELGEANVTDGLVRTVREWAGPKRRPTQVGNWNQVNLRSSANDIFSGTFVDQRIPLNQAQPGRYIYVVDAEGRIWLGPLNETIHHNSLVPPGTQVRSAGHISIQSNGVAHVNARSGHFMADFPILPSEEAAWMSSMSQTLERAGFRAGILIPGPGLLP